MTAGPSDEGDPNLHRPTLVDPAHDLDRREAPEGARPKVGPRFSTQTIAEGVQGSQGGTDFYLPLLGQPRISEVCAWGHLCTPNREILGYIYKPTSGKRPTEGMSLWWMR